MIKEVAFFAYPCRNVGSTRAWYERFLGLAFAGPYIEHGVEKYNEAHIGESCFSLMSRICSFRWLLSRTKEFKSAIFLMGQSVSRLRCATPRGTG